jgi:predicted DNA-binding transcriptional regulator YafY
MSYKFDSLMFILNKLDSHEEVTVDSLQEDLGVSERTVFRYLNALLVGGFPVVFNKKQGGYGFMEGYSLKQPDLSPEETLALSISKNMIRGMGSGWEESMDRIEQKLLVKKTDLPRHIVLSGKGLAPEITGHIGLIHKAIMNYQKVKMIYRPLYSDQKTKRKVDPYYLFFEEDFWYLRGYCHLREEPRTFALDRVISLKVLEEYFIPRNIAPEEELSGAFGTVVDGEPVEVVLRFDEEIKPYLQRKKCHQSQRERELKDGRLELRFSVNGLEGIGRWIYRWLPYVEVVSPKELRKGVKEELETALKKYNSPLKVKRDEQR